jgi:hypothetical protein
MNKWLELIFGLILVIGMLLFSFYSQSWGSWDFWSPAISLLKGGIFWAILGVGFVLILLGINDLKE